MIRVPRKAKPLILETKARLWKQDIRNAKTKIALKKAINKYKHKQIRDTLELMFNGKCAYCEAQLDHVTYGQIEHYRPTSKYPTSAVEWNNLLIACGVCNGAANKGDKFPTRIQNGPIVNPTKENPTKHLKFEYDLATKTAAVFYKTKRGKTTIEHLGLNRKKLVTHRSKFISKLVVLATMSSKVSDALDLLNDAKKKNSEYSAFAKTICRRYL